MADGKAYIVAYRPAGGDMLDKKLIVFYIIMGLILIGGTVALCLWLFPEIWPSQPDGWLGKLS
jgi:hypothetical protein